MNRQGVHIKPSQGKLGVLLVGLGAVSTTFIAGVEAVKAGLGKPIGSLTQMGTVRLGEHSDDRAPRIADFVPLAHLEDLVFGAWDIFPDDAYAIACGAKVLERGLLDRLRPELEAIRPMKGVFNPRYVRRLNGTHVKENCNKWELADMLKSDIEEFQRQRGIQRSVMVWCGSTESYLCASEVHQSLDDFEAGLRKSDDAIPSSMIYAYAALSLGIPFVNGAPNLTLDVPIFRELAKKQLVPICGKDLKTGQSLMKTIIAPGLKARLLGLEGWFSTNILGNRDGEVLDDPECFRTKERSKLSVLEHILERHLYPDLYGDFHHQVQIHYYPPRGDNKEGWDNVDIFGWLGYPMQIKIDFLCRDSILAAPLVLDLVLFLDLCHRAGMHGIQEWLSFYFKSPMTPPGLHPEHDLFVQLTKLQNTLRFLRGEGQVTHQELDYKPE